MTSKKHHHYFGIDRMDRTQTLLQEILFTELKLFTIYSVMIAGLRYTQIYETHTFVKLTILFYYLRNFPPNKLTFSNPTMQIRGFDQSWPNKCCDSSCITDEDHETPLFFVSPGICACVFVRFLNLESLVNLYLMCCFQEFTWLQ